MTEEERDFANHWSPAGKAAHKRYIQKVKYKER